MPARRPEIRDITYDEHEVAAGFRRRTWGRRPRVPALAPERLGSAPPASPASMSWSRGTGGCALRGSVKFGPPGRDQFGWSSEAFHTSRVRAVAPEQHSCSLQTHPASLVRRRRERLGPRGWLSLESALRPPKRHIDQVGVGKERRAGLSSVRTVWCSVRVSAVRPVRLAAVRYGFAALDGNRLGHSR